MSSTVLGPLVSESTMPEEGAPELGDKFPDDPDEPETDRATMDQHNAEPQNSPKFSAAQVSAIHLVCHRLIRLLKTVCTAILPESAC